MLLSGLNLGSSWCDQLSTEMMVDYVTGQLGGAKVNESHSPDNALSALFYLVVVGCGGYIWRVRGVGAIFGG